LRRGLERYDMKDRKLWGVREREQELNRGVNRKLCRSGGRVEEGGDGLELGN